MAFIKNTISTIFSYFLFFQSLLLQIIFGKKWNVGFSTCDGRLAFPASTFDFFSPSLIFIHLSLLLREWQWVEHFYSTQKRRDERCVFQTTAVSLWIKFHSNTERNKTNCFFESHLKSNLDTFFIREISVKTRNQNIFLIRASHSVHNKQRQQRRQQHLHGTIFQLRLIGPSKKSISSGALSLSLSPHRHTFTFHLFLPLAATFP